MSSITVSRRWHIAGIAAVSATAAILFALYQQRRHKLRRIRCTNYLESLPSLKNRYIVVRHGESTANVEGIISSDPVVATVIHGLTHTGKQQVSDACPRISELVSSYRQVVLLSSDLTRALETAQIIKDRLRLRGEVVIETGLRERNFGRLNGLTHDNYQRAWDRDLHDPYHQHFGVECVMSVLDRMTNVIAQCESKWSSAAIVLVSHGDPLQILCTAFHRHPASSHHSLPLLANAEARLLSLAPLDPPVDPHCTSSSSLTTSPNSESGHRSISLSAHSNS